MNAVYDPRDNTQTRLTKAVETAFFWNQIGNYLGWGGLFFVFLPPTNQLGILIITSVLPIAVILIPAFNIIIGLRLLAFSKQTG